MLTITDIFKPLSYMIPSLAISNNSGFSNQPVDDGIEIISSSASDIQDITLWGIDANDVLRSETITLTGTTVISSDHTDWKEIYGVYLGAVNGIKSLAAVGTITIREASGDLTITTITVGLYSAGSIFINLKGISITYENLLGSTFINPNGIASAVDSTTMSGLTNIDMIIRGEQILNLVSSSGSTGQVYVWSSDV